MSLDVLLTLLLAGLLIGMSKTAIGGFSLLATALVAGIIPTKESTGVVLLMLLTGDLIAMRKYRKYVEWKVLSQLIWPVIVGTFLGAVTLSLITDAFLRKLLGILVLLLVFSFPITNKWQKSNKQLDLLFPRAIRNFFGTLAGFMSMVANSGGPPMNIYLLMRRNLKMNFLGNTAWFFFALNLFKLPFTISLGIINFSSLKYVLPAIPMVIIGSLIGIGIINKINQTLFQYLTLIASGLVAVKLILQ